MVVHGHSYFPNAAKEKEKFGANFHRGSGLRRNGLSMLFYFLAPKSLINTHETHPREGGGSARRSQFHEC